MQRRSLTLSMFQQKIFVMGYKKVGLLKKLWNSKIESIQRAKVGAVKGQFFATRRDAAKHFGMKEGTLNKCIAEGWTLEEALGLSPRKPTKRQSEALCVSWAQFRQNKLVMNSMAYLVRNLARRKANVRGWTKRQAVD